MASNVELEVISKPKVNADPSIDVHTQRPRTPNIPYSFYKESQIKNIKQDRSTFFHCPKPIPELDYNKWRRRKVDFDYTSDQLWCRNSALMHTASRPGAYIPWGVSPSPGDKVCRHFCGESRAHFTEIDCYRRPATNRAGGGIFMKYGRPNRDYYAPKYPNEFSWFPSSVNLARDEGLDWKPAKDFRGYFQQAEDNKLNCTRQKDGNFTEYAMRYSLQVKDLPKMTTFERRKHQQWNKDADKLAYV